MTATPQTTLKNLYRWTAAVAGLVSAAIGPLLAQVVPDLKDPTLLRYTVAGLFFAYLAYSYVSDRFDRHMQPLLVGLVYTISGWLIWLNYLNNFHPALAYAMFEVVIGGSIAFVSLRALGLFLSAVMLTLGVATGLAPEVMVQREMYVSTVLVVAVLVFLVHSWRSYLQVQLERTAVLMESVFRNSADGLVLYRHGQPEKINVLAQRLLNIESAQDATSLLEHLNSNLDALRDQPQDIELTHLSGNSIWCEIVVTRVDRQQQLDLLRLTDISDRKRQELELTNALAARQAFLSTVSHELRTPLNGIIGASRLLAEEMPDASERDEPHNLLGLVQRSGDSLLATIDNMIDFNEASTDVAAVRSEPFSLAECVATLQHKFAKQAELKGLDFVVDLDTTLTDSRTGDLHRLRRALDVLINNAIKFTESGTIRLQVQAATSAALGTSTKIEFSVEDSGIGIELATQQQIFATFVQQEKPANRRFGGLGLGLALCQRVVVLLGGELHMSSTPGVGSRFAFDLDFPIAGNRTIVAPGSPKQVRTTAVTAVSARDHHSKVLLAEDNQINQVITLRMLRKLGYSADLAEDGLEVLKACEANHYSLILMDVQMPNMGGLEATEALRRKPDTHDIPIIALTANAADSDRDQCLAAGMDDFLAKPVDMTTLKNRIEKFVAA